MKRCEKIDFPNYRRDGDIRSKSWNEVTKRDLNKLGLTKDIAYDRSMEV